MVLLREVQCRWCGKVFCVCQSCWRGQAYCSDGCRRAAKCRTHREAQRKYRKTEKGKKAHREAENRRRMGLSKKNKKSVDDAGSTLQCSASTIARCVKASAMDQLEWGATPLLRTGRCHFCGSPGIIVDRFTRRGYGKQNSRRKWRRLGQEHDKSWK